MAASRKRKHIMKATIDSDSDEERDIDIGVSVNASGVHLMHREVYRSPKKQGKAKAPSPAPCIPQPSLVPDLAPEYNGGKRKQVSYIISGGFSRVRLL